MHEDVVDLQQDDCLDLLLLLGLVLHQTIINSEFRCKIIWRLDYLEECSWIGIRTRLVEIIAAGTIIIEIIFLKSSSLLQMLKSFFPFAFSLTP